MWAICPYFRRFEFLFYQNPIIMKLQPLFLTAFFALILIYACKKDNDSSGKTQFHVYLTDGPGDYQQVNVDIQQVRIKTSDDTSQWLDLQTNAGIYNLLDFQNGLDTLIAVGPIPALTLKEVRLVLGPDNSIMKDSVLYDLETPSAEQSGLKIKIDKNLGFTTDSLTLDFDADKSILETGNGKFILKPVIKVKD